MLPRIGESLLRAPQHDHLDVARQHRAVERVALGAGDRHDDPGLALEALGESVERAGDLYRVRTRPSDGGSGRTFEVDDVIAATGFVAPLLDLPELGVLVMQDPETGEQLVVDTQARGFRHRFADAARRREAALREALARAGVDAIELTTDDDIAAELARFVRLRKRRAQLAAGGLPRLRAATP